MRFTVIVKDWGYRIPGEQKLENVTTLIHRVISELDIGGGVDISIKREA